MISAGKRKMFFKKGERFNRLQKEGNITFRNEKLN